MSESTSIEWATHTFNPWQGCVKVSEACRNCYAASLGKRFGVEWGPQARRKFASESYWQKPLAWNVKAMKAGERPRVFCCSMADVFELLPAMHPDVEEMNQARQRLWRLIGDTQHLDWMLLTKRPENIGGMVPTGWLAGEWPRNAWVGTTAESQKEADLRLPLLLKHAQFAPVRFVSAEPLLGPLDLRGYLGIRHEDEFDFQNPDQSLPEARALGFHDPWVRGLDFVIAGGESGPGARPMHPDWARSLRDQCEAAGVSFHFKQAGNILAKEWGCTDKKVGLFSDIPNEFHVRQYPEVQNDQGFCNFSA